MLVLRCVKILFKCCVKNCELNLYHVYNIFILFYPFISICLQLFSNKYLRTYLLVQYFGRVNLTERFLHLFNSYSISVPISNERGACGIGRLRQCYGCMLIRGALCPAVEKSDKQMIMMIFMILDLKIITY